MRVTIRIVAGSLRGRKVVCNHSAELRPTPQMVREAFFSILGNAIPDRIFIDVFAGTGVVGMEALSRDAKQALFIERDFQLAQAIEQHLRGFGLSRQSKLYRTDAYRWIAAWQAPTEPVNVFVSPPFPDLRERSEEFRKAVATLQDKVAPESVIVIQGERGSPLEDDPTMAGWEERRYGRNVLLLWQKEDRSQETGDRSQEKEEGSQGSGVGSQEMGSGNQV
jgi:16S rRNA (guanine966-N2)-methyltransferase